MGEFIIYYNGKIIGGIHDDRLLNSAIEEEKDIIRLSSRPKINFAKTGFELHEKGDIKIDKTNWKEDNNESQKKHLHTSVDCIWYFSV